MEANGHALASRNLVQYYSNPHLHPKNKKMADKERNYFSLSALILFTRYKQERIKSLLIRDGMVGDDLERDMCSHLSDLDETVS